MVVKVGGEMTTVEKFFDGYRRKHEGKNSSWQDPVPLPQVFNTVNIITRDVQDRARPCERRRTGPGRSQDRTGQMRA